MFALVGVVLQVLQIKSLNRSLVGMLVHKLNGM